ncbi:MAG: hypothetical protein KGZ88_18020 [Methylomicrobium sp.]|nr:hypothetical protein [Methylomicrobium sp.]
MNNPDGIEAAFITKEKELPCLGFVTRQTECRHYFGVSLSAIQEINKTQFSLGWSAVPEQSNIDYYEKASNSNKPCSQEI